MTQKEFLSTLDFTMPERLIKRELGVRELEFTVNNNRNFSIDLKKIDNKILNFIFNNIKKCVLVSDKVVVTDNSYKANIVFKGPGKTQFKIGEIKYIDGKWDFKTSSELNQKTSKKTKARKTRTKISKSTTSKKPVMVNATK